MGARQMTPVKSKTYKKKPASKESKVAASKKPKSKALDAEILESEDEIISAPSLNPNLNPVSEVEINPEKITDLVPIKDRDLLSTYIREMLRFPLLTPDEEKNLARKSFVDHDREAFARLIQANLRFVVKLAFEYARYGAKVLDLIQEGNMGLIKAVQDFDPSKDVRLTTYAVYWIRSYMQDYLLKNWSLVKIGTTAAQKKLFYRLKKEQERMEREGLALEPKAIAMNLGVEEADVKLMQERLSGGDVSLSAPVPGRDGESDGLSMVARIPDQSPLPGAALEETEQKELFHKALGEFIATLEPRDALIFRDRLVTENPKTLLEIGQEHGFSKERARQIEERLKESLRKFLIAKYPDISLH